MKRIHSTKENKSDSEIAQGYGSVRDHKKVQKITTGIFSCIFNVIYKLKRSSVNIMQTM